MSQRYQTRSTSAQKSSDGSAKDAHSNSNHNNNDLSQHRSSAAQARNSENNFHLPGMESWQASTSGTEWESNSSFSAEQHLRGIVNILSVRSNFNIYNLYSSTGFNPSQPSSFNFHLLLLIYIDNTTNTWATVVNPSMIPPLQHQPSQHEVYIQYLSFLPTFLILFLLLVFCQQHLVAPSGSHSQTSPHQYPNIQREVSIATISSHLSFRTDNVLVTHFPQDSTTLHDSSPSLPTSSGTFVPKSFPGSLFPLLTDQPVRTISSHQTLDQPVRTISSHKTLDQPTHTQKSLDAQKTKLSFFFLIFKWI